MTAPPARRKSVVIVTFSYWPVANARALRWTSLAEAWAQAGLAVCVVCAWQKGRPAEETVNGVQIHRVGLAPIEKLRGLLASQRTEPAVRGDEPPSGARAPGARILAAIVRLGRGLWREIYWPDTTCLWYLPARRKVSELVAAARPDALVSVSPTFTAVAVGYRALRRAATRPRWLVDLGDPFSFLEEAPPNNPRLYRRLNYRFERSCLHAADAVAVTNPATRERYAELFPESAGKLAVIPPLLSLSDLPAPSVADDRIRLVFLGTLYRSIRRPDFLLALLAALRAAPLGPRLELHIFGDASECRSSIDRHAPLLGRLLFLHGTVPRPRALQALADASVLVNLGNVTSYQLPSKLVEYAATGKPILNIAASASDSSTAFLAGYPKQLTLLAHGDRPSEDQVVRCERFLRDAGAPVDPAAQGWLTPFRLPAVSRQYLEALAL